MTPPSRVLPGTTYLITRRCSERRFFLRPSRLTNEIFLFVLALAAQRYEILVHACCVLSNHVHLIVTDPHARLPAFMQYLDSLVARAVNASIGRFEGFWATDGSYSAVEPIDPADVLAKAAYVLANPVAAGLVRRAADWPGVWTAPEQIGGDALIVRKPSFFFDPNGYIPATLELQLVVPRGFASADEFRALLSCQLQELEFRAQQKVESKGRRFAGVARVLAQDPFSCPATAVPRFGLKPRIAARDKWKRIEGVFRVKSFEQAYWKSRDERRAGLLGVVFPAGTYLLRIMHGVICAGAA